MNGKLIRQRRKEIGMTLKELADAVGVTESTISRYETGKIQYAPIDTAFRMAGALEVKVDDLVRNPAVESTTASPKMHVSICIAIPLDASNLYIYSDKEYFKEAVNGTDIKPLWESKESDKVTAFVGYR